MPTSRRLEFGLILAVVVFTTLYMRADSIPQFSSQHIDVSETRYSYDVGDPGPWFSAWSLGDGQAYVLIAVDPTGKKLAAEIPEAGYRFARAGYGWAGWVVSFGQPDLVPYALALVGLLCVVGVFLVAVRMRPILGRRAWLIVLNPALYVGFARDTAEPMGILFIALTLATGSAWTAIALGASRPTYVIGLWGRWKLVLAGVTTGLAIGVYGLVVFGASAMVPSGGRIGPPLVAYAEHPSVSAFILAALAGATVVVGFRNRDLAWVLSGVLILCLGDDVLRAPVNAWRAAGFLPVLWAFGTNYVVVRRPAVPAASTLT